MKLRTVVLDCLGIAMSLLCLIHCLLIPLILTIAPVYSVSFMEDERFHMIALLIALPISLMGLGISYLTHKNLYLLGWAFLGFVFMISGLLFHGYETVLTSIGGIIIICTHMFNWRQHYLFHGHGTCHRHCKPQKQNSPIVF